MIDLSKISFIAFVLASLVSFSLGYYIQWVTKRILERGQEAEGLVVGIRDIPRKRRGAQTQLEDREYSFEYELGGRKWLGKCYQKMDGEVFIDRKTALGDQLAIKYDPQAPKNFILQAEEKKVKDRGKWLMMVGGLVLIFSSFLYLTQ